MSWVFTSEGTGAGVHVFSDDHCPPHVHARHRAEGWVARVKFAYLGRSVELLSIAPVRNIPLRRAVNRLLDDIEGELAAGRRSWWALRQTVCLANQWAVFQASGLIELASETTKGAKQITEAVYRPEQDRLRATFRDGTTINVSTGQ